MLKLETQEEETTLQAAMLATTSRYEQPFQHVTVTQRSGHGGASFAGGASGAGRASDANGYAKKATSGQSRRRFAEIQQQSTNTEEVKVLEKILKPPPHPLPLPRVEGGAVWADAGFSYGGLGPLKSFSGHLMI